MQKMGTILEKPRKIESLQVVRAIAFVSIYIFHAIRTFPGNGFVYKVFSSSLGPWGVSIFFVLSGFLMTYSYWNRPPKVTAKSSFFFAIKKIKRLFPLHLIMLLIGSIYLIIKNEKLSNIFKQLIITIPLIQTWFPQNYQAINTVAWYLSVTLFLYFMFPYLLKYVRKLDNNITIITFISSLYLLQVLIGYIFKFSKIDIKWITYCHPVYRLVDFSIGCLIASLMIKNSNIKQNQSLSKIKCSLMEIVAIVLNIAVCLIYIFVPDSLNYYKYTCLFLPASCFLVYIFSFDKGIVSHFLKNRVMFWLADISPYGFLIHRLVIYYFYSFIFHFDPSFSLNGSVFNYLFVIVVPFIATVITVYIYRFFERFSN